MAKIICALGIGEGLKRLGDSVADGGVASGLGFAQGGFELCEDHFDGIEVRRVRRQEEQMSSGSADRRAGGFCLVATQIVDNDDVAGLERRHKRALDIAAELDAVDGPVE